MCVKSNHPVLSYTDNTNPITYSARNVPDIVNLPAVCCRDMTETLLVDIPRHVLQTLIYLRGTCAVQQTCADSLP